MMHITHWALVAILVLLGPARVAAQEPGDRIRVTTEGGVRVGGRLERAGADTLVMVGGDSIRRTIPLANVRRLDVARGRASRTRGIVRGAAIGLGVGALVGGAFGALTYDDDACGAAGEGFCLDLGRGFGAYVGAIGFGTLGAVAGGTAGALRDPTRWVRIAPGSRVRVGVRPEGGVALGASVPVR